MAFRKRKKEAQKQQRLETRLTNEQRVEAAIADAGKIADPGEKLLKFKEILADIKDVLETEEQLITDKAEEAAFTVIGSGAITSMAMCIGGGITAIVAPPTAPIALSVSIAAIPTMMASLPVIFFRHKSVKKKFNAEAKAPLQTMKDFQQSVTGMKDELVTYILDHKGEMLRSPVYEKVSKLPDFSEAFEGLVAQELAKYEEMQSAAKEAPAKPASLTKPKIVLSRPPQA